MKRSVLRVVMAAAAFTLAAAGAAQASSGVPYTFTGTEHESFVDQGLCSNSATITVDAHFALHVNATRASLTEEQIEEALFSEGGSDLFTSVTYTETGSFVAVESTGERIRGHFTEWFGGNLTANGTMVFTDIFAVNGVDQWGNQIHAHDVSHATIVSGDIKSEFERGSVTGCPS